MIEVTEEMIATFSNADFTGCGNADWEDSHIRIGLTAVFKLIDPVPDGVTVIKDRHGNEYYLDEPATGNVWRCEYHCCHYTFTKLQAERGPMTWEVPADESR